MKTLKIWASISAVLGFFAALAVIFLFLSLSEIAGSDKLLKQEWYIAGTCLIIISAFIISTAITLGLIFKHLNTREIINLMTDYDLNRKSSGKKEIIA